MVGKVISVNSAKVKFSEKQYTKYFHISVHFIWRNIKKRPILCESYACNYFLTWWIGKKIHIEPWGHHDVRIEKTSVLSSFADKHNFQYNLLQSCEQYLDQSTIQFL